jgi:outer membrane immunogenic protein
LKRLLLAGAAFGVLAAPAMAADMAVKAPAPYPYLWNGFYAGLNAGYADEQSTFTTAANYTPDTVLGVGAGISEGLASLSSGRIVTNNGMGFIGGGQVGYNLQMGKLWVAGLEADIQGKTGSSTGSVAGGNFIAIPASTPFTSVQTVSASTDWLGTVRGRFGLLLTPTWLVYFTGGLAFGGSNGNSTLSQSGGPFFGTGAANFSNTRIGGTYGAGLEWMFARNWSAKAEYLFYDLGTANFSYAATAGVFKTPVYQTVTNTAHLEGNIARLGVNYHF